MIMMKSKNFQKGFSLVEMLVAVAVLGTLTGISIVTYNGYTNKVIKKTLEAYADNFIREVKICSIFKTNINDCKKTNLILSCEDNTEKRLACLGPVGIGTNKLCLVIGDTNAGNYHIAVKYDVSTKATEKKYSQSGQSAICDSNGALSGGTNNKNQWAKL